MMHRKEMLDILQSDDPGVLDDLYKQAYKAKQKHVGCIVYFRGIIEFSNICVKNCLYCGIRRNNTDIHRFAMSEEEIVDTASCAYRMGYGSIVLQSGERTDHKFIDFVERVIKSIKRSSQGKLGITLSLGEQLQNTFKRWFDAGAHRYLLRMETSNRELYRRIHPDNHDYNERLKCLGMLRDIGYQVGTGVMIGLPYQTCEDLVDDIFFFKEYDIDMIGMGPYIVHENTPLVNVVDINHEKNFRLGLKMISLTRLYLKDVNIAATTALQSLDQSGREKGMKAGANIIMPNITPVKYRDSYQLYGGKPCLDENTFLCRDSLQKRIEDIGEKIGYNQWGDSPHFFKRQK